MSVGTTASVIGRVGVAMVVATTLTLGGSTSTQAVEETRFCITVRSDAPIEGDLFAAVASGEASITIEEPGACAPDAVVDATPSPEPTLLPIDISGTAVTGTPEQLLATLRVEPEDAEGYDRKRFKLWVDANGNGCNARQEVLIRDSLTPVALESKCKVTDGQWYSVYDGLTTTNASTFDVDHVVPLKEAWRSSAKTWTDDRRKEFANDLGDARALRAVSASSNRSKGDRDPADWLPPDVEFQCEYVSDWVSVKVRWDLAVDAVERDAIEEIIVDCPVELSTVNRE